MASNKRPLDDQVDASQPSAKRRKTDQLDEKEATVKVRFTNHTNDIIFKKSELILVEFCKAKLDRWSSNPSNQDPLQPEYYIDLSVFPCISPTIFTAILQLQHVFVLNNAHNNQSNQAAAILLRGQIRISHLPQLFEACKILLVTQIFDVEIFKHYFYQHPPIPVDMFMHIQHLHKNDTFLSSIITAQIPSYNVMNNYAPHVPLYDEFNKKKSHSILSGVVPNGKHVMAYAIKQIQYEQKRELYRKEVHEEFEPDYDCDLIYNDEIGDEWTDKHEEDPYFVIIDEQKGYVIPHSFIQKERKMSNALRKDIDFGLCAAFEDMIGICQCLDIHPFLQVFFKFIDAVFGDDAVFTHRDSHANVLDRSCFCFYALLYILHRIWILSLQQHITVLSANANSAYISAKIQKVCGLYDRVLFDALTKKYLSSEKAKILTRRRINDGLMYKAEWNRVCTERSMHFPQRVAVQSCIICDPKWLVDNLALKCNNGDCIVVLHRIFEYCAERRGKINISQTLKCIFQSYLGATIL